jgi:hypothetical protein
MALRKSLVGVLVSTLLLVPVGLAHARPTSQASQAATIPVTGSLPGGGSFAGTLDVTRFVVQNGQLTAVGSLSGTLRDALGNVIGTVSNVLVNLTVTQPTGSCQILHLVLGPLDLNLLGLMVHLNQVVLDITAQQGPGNLLGNLLCAVAHLLDNTGNTTGLARLLNLILSILG